MSNFVFQNTKDNKDFKKKHLKTILVFIIVIFGIYSLKLFSLQVIQGTNFLQQSQTISQRQRFIPAQRGEIYDRNKDFPLVVNIDSFAVDLIPGEIPSGMYDTVALRLAQYLGITKSSIDRKIPEKDRRSYTSFE
nr:penicillin-binding protein 2 [Treponemataceae bacterium]